MTMLRNNPIGRRAVLAGGAAVIVLGGANAAPLPLEPSATVLFYDPSCDPGGALLQALDILSTTLIVVEGKLGAQAMELDRLWQRSRTPVLAITGSTGQFVLGELGARRGLHMAWQVQVDHHAGSDAAVALFTAS